VKTSERYRIVSVALNRGDEIRTLKRLASAKKWSLSQTMKVALADYAERELESA
jgi:hypothetical protein